MGKFIRKSKSFINKNSSTILTWFGAFGVVITSVSAVKATPKVLKLLEKAEREKGEKLTISESVKVSGVMYIPSVLFGISTIACIFGSNVINKHTQSALVSAYTMLDNSYKEYRRKIREVYGEEVDRSVREEIVKDKYDETSRSTNFDSCLYFDSYSGRYFESSIDKIIKAEYELNKELIVYGEVSLNFWYNLIGLSPVTGGDKIGWTIDDLGELSWLNWMDQMYNCIENGYDVTFMIDRDIITIDDDLECCILTFHYDPVIFAYYP